MKTPKVTRKQAVEAAVLHLTETRAAEREAHELRVLASEARVWRELFRIARSKPRLLGCLRSGALEPRVNFWPDSPPGPHVTVSLDIHDPVLAGMIKDHCRLIQACPPALDPFQIQARLNRELGGCDPAAILAVPGNRDKIRGLLALIGFNPDQP